MHVQPYNLHAPPRPSVRGLFGSQWATRHLRIRACSATRLVAGAAQSPEYTAGSLRFHKPPVASTGLCLITTGLSRIIVASRAGISPCADLREARPLPDFVEATTNCATSSDLVQT